MKGNKIMCKLNAGIMLEDRSYIYSMDDNTDTLQEFYAAYRLPLSRIPLIRVELFLPDSDIFADPDLWVYDINRDIIPDWTIKELLELKRRFTAAAKKWYKAHVFVNTDNLEFFDNDTYYLKDCKNATFFGRSVGNLEGKSSGEFLNQSSGILRDFCTGEFYHDSKGKLYEDCSGIFNNKSICESYGENLIKLYDCSSGWFHREAIVNLYNASTGFIPFYTNQDRKNCILHDDATLKDCSQLVY